MVNFNVSKYVPSGATVKSHLTTAKAWELEKQESALAPKDVWTNQDSEQISIKVI